MNATVFVTGGAGYVGSHCCKAFAAAGWRVVCFDNLSRGWRDMVRWGPLIEGDIRDQAALRGALREARPDVVAHFAALAYVGESAEDPALYYHNNVAGSLTLLEAMRAEGVARLVFSSTCAVYGVAGGARICEEAPQAPVSPYGRSKQMVELMIQDYAAAYGLEAVILRYFNASGSDPEGEIGERHEPELHVIPRALMAVRDGRRDFTIFGSDYPTPDGSCVRDYIHVTDLGEAHLQAIRRLQDGRGGGVFNLGGGVGTSVLEVAAAVERVTGIGLDRRIGPRRAGDPPMAVADPARALEGLGWRAQRSQIDEIVETAWRWLLAEKARGLR